MGPVVYIKKDRFQFPPEKKVIKAQEYLTYVKAEGLLEKARQEAEAIVAAAKEVFEGEKRRGYEEGLVEGKMTISEQMIDTVSKSVDYFATIEEKVADTVILALKKIIGEIDARDLIMKVVKNALTIVRNEQRVTVRVSPSQTETVKEKLNEIMANFPGVSFIDVVADPRLTEGGCILETDIGVVDARIEVQIEAIRKALLKSFKGRT
jgi:type III secretion protein L